MAQTLWTLDPINGKISLDFSHHRGQARAWKSSARFIFVIAGTQGGKTSFGPWWLWREIGLKGGGDYIAATSSFDLFKLKMLPEIRNTFEHLLGVGRYWSGDKILEIQDPTTGKFWAKRFDDPMWARVILRSAQSPSGLESSTAKGAWLDECGQPEFTLNVWEAVRRRLSLYRGRALGTTTPYELGWLKTNIVDLADRPGSDIEVITFESIVNPSFPQQEFLDAQRVMVPWKFDMMYRGIFSRPAGAIFPDFDPSYRKQGGHVVETFPVPEHWTRFVGIDPGIINTCKVWIAQDPETNIFYAYKEELGDRKSAVEHAEEALLEAQALGIYVAVWAVGSKSEVYQREDWEEAGAGTVLEPQYADVESGIDRIIRFLRTRRLFFMESCDGLIGQMKTYARKLGTDGLPVMAIKDKERYHYIDALRYVSQHLNESLDSYGGGINYAEYSTLSGQY